MLLHSLLLALIATTSGWTLSSTISGSCVARGAAVSSILGTARFGAVCMQEEAGEGSAAAATDEVSDFTEDLLDALSTDEPAAVEEPPQFYKSDGSQQLDTLPSFTNMQSVDAIRSKCVPPRRSYLLPQPEHSLMSLPGSIGMEE